MAHHRRPDQATTEPKEDAGDEASPSPAEEPAQTLEDTFEEDFAHHLQQQLDDDLHELQVPAASWVETKPPVPYHSTCRRRPRHLPSISLSRVALALVGFVLELAPIVVMVAGASVGVLNILHARRRGYCPIPAAPGSRPVRAEAE